MSLLFVTAKQFFFTLAMKNRILKLKIKGERKERIAYKRLRRLKSSGLLMRLTGMISFSIKTELS